MLWTNLPLSIIVGAIVSARIGTTPSCVWAGCGVLLSVLRLLDFYSFPRRRLAATDGELARRYAVGIVCFGLHWGAASAVLLLTDDIVSRFWVVGLQGAVLVTTALRSHPLLKTAVTFICLILLPLAAALLMMPDPVINLYVIPCLLYLSSIASLTRQQHRRTIRLLEVEEELTAAAARRAEADRHHARATAKVEQLARLSDRRVLHDGKSGPRHLVRSPALRPAPGQRIELRRPAPASPAG